MSTIVLTKKRLSNIGYYTNAQGEQVIPACANECWQCDEDIDFTKAIPCSKEDAGVLINASSVSHSVNVNGSITHRECTEFDVGSNYKTDYNVSSNISGVVAASSTFLGPDCCFRSGSAVGEIQNSITGYVCGVDTPTNYTVFVDTAISFTVLLSLSGSEPKYYFYINLVYASFGTLNMFSFFDSPTPVANIGGGYKSDSASFLGHTVYGRSKDDGLTTSITVSVS